jgi:hypothetical protein
MSVDEPDRKARGRRRQREHRAVVGDAQRRAMPDQVRDRRAARGDEDPGLPAEEHDRRDREHEPERHSARLDALDGHREALDDDHADEQRDDRDQLVGRVRRAHERHDCGADCDDPRHKDGGHDRKNSGRWKRGSIHHPVAGRGAPRGSAPCFPLSTASRG